MTLSDTPILNGKRGLILGVANSNSIAWGIARQCDRAGASLAFNYLNESFVSRVEPLAKSIDAPILEQCDVSKPEQLDRLFDRIKQEWGQLDFLVHSIAFSDRAQLKGRMIDMTRENFLTTLDVSCYSFIDVVRRASELMVDGGSIINLTFAGSNRVMPNYNAMGIAKAALEAATRYAAYDLGERGIRVNSLSPGPVRTISGAGISNARKMMEFHYDNAPLNYRVEIDEIGQHAVYLLSDMSRGLTGQVITIDAGYGIMQMPNLDKLTNPT